MDSAVVDSLFYTFNPEDGITIDQDLELVRVYVVIKDWFQESPVIRFAQATYSSPIGGTGGDLYLFGLTRRTLISVSDKTLGILICGHNFGVCC